MSGRLPRDMSGDELCRCLRRLGYGPVRQTGSPVYCADAHGRGVVVPRHARLKIGTLNAIIRAVAEQQGVSKEEIQRRIFGS